MINYENNKTVNYITENLYNTLERQGTPENLINQRFNLVQRRKKNYKLYTEQAEQAKKANALLNTALSDDNVSLKLLDEIETQAIIADNEAYKLEQLEEAYLEAIDLLDELIDTLLYIEANEEG